MAKKRQIFIFLVVEILIEFVMRCPSKNRVSICFAALVLWLQACITDEFRVKDLTMDDQWEITIVSPLFSAKQEFKDFVHNWALYVPYNPSPYVVLDYRNNEPDKKIPRGFIFDKSTVIDSFPLVIKGNYKFSEVKLVFKVENSSPLPLNLRVNFFQQNRVPEPQFAILPISFKAANFTDKPVVPITTTETVTLSEAQLANFILANRFTMDSWFDDNGFLQYNDTIWAHYPINVTIELVGKVKAKQDEKKPS